MSKIEVILSKGCPNESVPFESSTYRLFKGLSQNTGQNINAATQIYNPVLHASTKKFDAFCFKASAENIDGDSVTVFQIDTVSVNILN